MKKGKKITKKERYTTAKIEVYPLSSLAPVLTCAAECGPGIGAICTTASCRLVS